MFLLFAYWLIIRIAPRNPALCFNPDFSTSFKRDSIEKHQGQSWFTCRIMNYFDLLAFYKPIVNTTDIMFCKNNMKWFVDRLAGFRCISFPAINTLPIELTQTTLSFLSWITLKDTKGAILSGTATYGIKVSPDFLQAWFDQIISGQMPQLWQQILCTEADLGVASTISSMIKDNIGWEGEWLETFEKCSILFKFKEGENFNHRNTYSILRIKIWAWHRNWAKGGFLQRSRNNYAKNHSGDPVL